MTEKKNSFQLMDDICKKIGMANNREYSLAFADGEEAELLEGRDLKKLEMLKEKLRTEDEGEKPSINRNLYLMFMHKNKCLFISFRYYFSLLARRPQDAAGAGCQGVGATADETKIFLLWRQCEQRVRVPQTSIKILFITISDGQGPSAT